MAKEKAKALSQNSDGELRFLVAHRNRSLLTGTFEITKSLEEAEAFTGQLNKPSAEVTSSPKDVDGKSFSSIQKEITAAIADHLALDGVMGILTQAGIDMQFMIFVRSKLQKFGNIVSESKDRSIYSFHKTREREVFDQIVGLNSTANGIAQLPKLLIIGIVSEYDVFLRKLIRTAIFYQKHAALQIDRSLSLKDLAAFSTIDEARDYLIDREVDAILHDDHLEQLLAVNKLFNVKIDVTDDCILRFLEICERRNLFTHNAGVVNERYLSKCKQFGVNTKDAKLGDRLGVTSVYFRNAVSTIHELSIKTTQFLWRKLVPKERGEADSKLNDTAFQILRGDDYQLAERILDYGLHHTGAGKEDVRRMMVVNYANAIKLGGDVARAESELDKYDWSATEVKYRMCVAAVRGQVEEVVKLLPAVARADEVNMTAVREWPVFKSVREDRLFQEKVRKIFGEDIISSKPTLVEAPQQLDVKPKNKRTGTSGKPHTKH